MNFVTCTAAIAIAATGICKAQDAKPNEDVIIVTGEKIDRDLQDTVSSVGLVTGEQLEQDGVLGLADAFDYIANINLNQVDEGFSIRGIPFDNLLGAGSSPLAQIYVDDVTIGDQATRFSTESLWDIDQIEVLRGAQSTVQGRNALAGAVIIRTANPTFDWEGKARATYFDSEYGNDYSVAGAFGGPIVDDKLAFRIAAERRESDGFVENAVTGEEGADFNDTWLGRAKLLWTPTPTVTSLLTVTYTEADVASPRVDRRAVDANGFTLLDTVVPGSESNRLSFQDAADFNRSTQWLYSLNTDWEVTNALTLTFVTAYSDSEINEQLDTDNANIDPAIWPTGPFTINNPFGIETIPETIDEFRPEGTQFETQTIFTQEVTASFDNGGRWRGLAGAYYAKSEEDEFNFTPGIQPGLLDIVTASTSAEITAAMNALLGGTGLPQTAIDVAAETSLQSVLANYTEIGAFVAITSEPLDIENYALYAQGEFDISEKLTLGLGFRYDFEEQEEGLTLSGDPLGLPDPATATVFSFPDPGLAPLIDPAIIGVTQATVAGTNAVFDATLAEADTLATQDFEAFLPSGFIRYSFDDDRSLAFSVRRGYRSGGSDLNIPRQFVSQFDPEYTTNYELALRSYWFDRALRLNANIFYTDWTDQQVVVSLSTFQQDEVGFNVGSSTLKGFEVDALATLNENWSVQGVLGYVDTEFEDFDAALAETIIEAQGQTSPIDLEQTLAAFEGQEFAFAPDWTGALRVVYDGDAGLFGTLGVTYEGSSFVNNANSGSATFLNNEERTLVNATIGYEFGQATIALVGRNLFDEEYVSSGGNELVRLGDPRQVGIQLQKNF